MKRKIFSLVLIVIILFGILFVLTGCGDESKNNSNVEDEENLPSLASQVKIGDYVAYNAGAGNSYTSPKEKNGSSNQTFETTGDEKWRVIDIDDDGTVSLISEGVINSKTDSMFSLDEATGYANAITELDNISSIFGNGDHAVSARSVTFMDLLKIIDVETIANYMNVDLSSYANEDEKMEALLEKYSTENENSKNTQYGQTFSIVNSDYQYVPNNKAEDGYKKESGLTVEDSYVPQIKVDTYMEDKEILSLAFGEEKGKSFWLANTEIQVSGHGRVDETNKFYAVYRVKFACIDGSNYLIKSNKLFNSDKSRISNDTSNVKSVRPVIILDKNTKVSGGEGTETSPYEISGTTNRDEYNNKKDESKEEENNNEESNNEETEDVQMEEENENKDLTSSNNENTTTATETANSYNLDGTYMGIHTFDSMFSQITISGNNIVWGSPDGERTGSYKIENSTIIATWTDGTTSTIDIVNENQLTGIEPFSSTKLTVTFNKN